MGETPTFSRVERRLLLARSLTPVATMISTWASCPSWANGPWLDPSWSSAVPKKPGGSLSSCHGGKEQVSSVTLCLILPRAKLRNQTGGLEWRVLV